MLSLRIGFRVAAGSRLPTATLASKSRRKCEASLLLFPIFSAPLCPNVSEQGNGAMSRSAHFEQNKGILLYFRSRSESVIVIFANYRSIRRYYRAYASRLCMLAYRFYTLSKPVTPGKLFNTGTIEIVPASYYIFFCSFAQVSRRPMVLLNTSFPTLLSGSTV